MSTDLKMIADKYQDYLIEMRRYFHRHPELSFREIETGNKISDELKAMGIECRKVPAGDSFGITGTIRGGRPGKTILLAVLLIFARLPALKICLSFNVAVYTMFSMTVLLQYDLLFCLSRTLSGPLSVPYLIPIVLRRCTIKRTAFAAPSA